MRIFLDIGGHYGETLREVVDARYGFDKIYCFEPAPPCWPTLEAIVDPRIEICHFGLWRRDDERPLYGTGGPGASIFPDAEAIDRNAPTTVIKLVRASSWVAAHSTPGDVVFVKLNCEGSECDVVDDLLDADLLRHMYSVMIDFDVRKVPSLGWREGEVRARLRHARLENVCFTEDVMYGATHEERIRRWLLAVGGNEQLPLEELRLRHGHRLRELSSRRGYRMRLEVLLRRAILKRLPQPLQGVAKRAWRSLVPSR